MLYRTLNENRAAIAARVSERAAQRSPGWNEHAELRAGVLLFLSQLSDLLFLRHADPCRSDVEERREIARSGGEHGRRLQRLGLSAAHAVHDYGDVGRALAEVAERKHARLTSDDYETLTLCIDAAVAGAVIEHARAQARAQRDPHAPESVAPVAVWERMATPVPASPRVPGAWAAAPAGNRTHHRSG